MRAPLDKIEWVDKYLTGKLTEREQLDFQKALETDAELKQLLELQKLIIETAQRKAIKTQIAKNIKQANFWSRFRKWGFGGAGLVILVAVVLLQKNDVVIKQVMHTFNPAKKEVPVTTDSSSMLMQVLTVDSIKAKTGSPIIITPEPVKMDSTPVIPVTAPLINDERIDFQGLKTWVEPVIQYFTVNISKGAAIEGKEGTLVIVPANAFVDENNNPVTGEVTVELIEALTLEDMVLYNLGTTSDGNPLKTGGMLHFDFKANGKKVNVSPQRPLYVKVPTPTVEKGMMLFRGEVANGKVNWKNPKPLKKYLINVDFESLDFLPEGFAEKAKSIGPYEGYAEVTNALIDSLYYSVEFCERESRGVFRRGKTKPSKGPAMPGETDAAELFQVEQKETGCCGIDPIAIQTIKTQPYSKTFIATQEFAKRVKALHRLESGNELLGLYLKNLNKDLCDVDSLVTRKLNDNNKVVFEEFAREKLSNIQDAQIYQEQFNAYYNKKKQEFKQAKEQLEKDLSAKKNSELTRMRTSLKRNIFDGITLLPSSKPAQTTYDFNWASSGWVNIDEYLHLLEKKGAQEVIVRLTKTEGTTEVYQWINNVKNLNPLNVETNVAKAYFPLKGKAAQEAERTFCMAISRKDGQYCWFDKEYNPYQTKELTVELMPSTLPEIKARLKKYNVKNDLEARLDLVEKMVNKELSARQTKSGKGLGGVVISVEFGKNNKSAERRRLLKEAAFPCYNPEQKNSGKKSKGGAATRDVREL